MDVKHEVAEHDCFKTCGDLDTYISTDCLHSQTPDCLCTDNGVQNIPSQFYGCVECNIDLAEQSLTYYQGWSVVCNAYVNEGDAAAQNLLEVNASSDKILINIFSSTLLPLIVSQDAIYPTNPNVTFGLVPMTSPTTIKVTTSHMSLTAAPTATATSSEDNGFTTTVDGITVVEPTMVPLGNTSVDNNLDNGIGNDNNNLSSPAEAGIIIAVIFATITLSAAFFRRWRKHHKMAKITKASKDAEIDVEASGIAAPLMSHGNVEELEDNKPMVRISELPADLGPLANIGAVMEMSGEHKTVDEPAEMMGEHKTVDEPAEMIGDSPADAEHSRAENQDTESTPLQNHRWSDSTI